METSRNNKEYWKKYKREWFKRWVKNNPELSKKMNVEKQRKWRVKAREYINREKMHPCMDCKIKYSPWIMQFDHRNPSEKKMTIGQSNFGNIKKIKNEISKCDVVCANCHAERTHKLRMSGKYPGTMSREIQEVAL